MQNSFKSLASNEQLQRFNRTSVSNKPFFKKAFPRNNIKQNIKLIYRGKLIIMYTLEKTFLTIATIEIF